MVDFCTIYSGKIIYSSSNLSCGNYFVQIILYITQYSFEEYGLSSYPFIIKISIQSYYMSILKCFMFTPTFQNYSVVSLIQWTCIKWHLQNCFKICTLNINLYKFYIIYMTQYEIPMCIILLLLILFQCICPLVKQFFFHFIYLLFVREVDIATYFII